MKAGLSKIVRACSYAIASISMVMVIISIAGFMLIASLGLTGKSEMYCQDYAIHKVAYNYAGAIISSVDPDSIAEGDTPSFPEIQDMSYVVMYAENPEELTFDRRINYSNTIIWNGSFPSQYQSVEQRYRKLSGETIICGSRTVLNDEIATFHDVPTWRIVTRISSDYGNIHRTTDENIYYYRLYYYVDTDNLTQPEFQEAKAIGSAIYTVEQYLLPVLILSVIFMIASIIHLLVFSRKEANLIHKIPYLVFLGISAAAVGIAISLCALLFDVYYDMSFNVYAFAFLAFVLLSLACYFLIEVIVNTVERIKLHIFWRNTVCYYIKKACGKFVRYINNHASLLAKVIIGVILLSVIQLVIIGTLYGIPGLGIFLGIIYKIAAVFFMVKLVADYRKLSDGVSRVAAGDSITKIDTTKMITDLKRTSENINNIGDGISIAVGERIKSERMKTELITNVSHDIKTPLTSIINYVDLLEKKDIGANDTEVSEYLEVLSRQSARLKKLIEDLIEASKASTGNVEMNIEDINAAMILSQAAAEFDDKLQKKNLSLIMSLPDEPQLIKADGRYLWRVIDNLLNNICKYSMDGSRVYVDMNDNRINFKNVSSAPLNISADELTERFVRGDSSRNTEGSGLGLSIAKSLTELMGGQFEITIDGDLFKVTLTFEK